MCSPRRGLVVSAWSFAGPRGLSLCVWMHSRHANRALARLALSLPCACLTLQWYWGQRRLCREHCAHVDTGERRLTGPLLHLIAFDRHASLPTLCSALLPNGTRICNPNPAPLCAIFRVPTGTARGVTNPDSRCSSHLLCQHPCHMSRLKFGIANSRKCLFNPPQAHSPGCQQTGARPACVRTQ